MAPNIISNPVTELSLIRYKEHVRNTGHNKIMEEGNLQLFFHMDVYQENKINFGSFLYFVENDYVSIFIIEGLLFK